MPIGEYPDFDSCVSAMMDKGKDSESAHKICGEMEKRMHDANTKTELIEQDGDLYLKAFLLDSSVNANNWGVDAKTLPENIRSFIGKPIILYTKNGEFDHTTTGDTYEHVLEYQKNFGVADIKDIVVKDGVFSALAKVTNPEVAAAIREGKLPSYVSPQIYHYNVGKEPDDKASGWKGTHLAIVDKPAFGVQRARITAQCSGSAETCLNQLKYASDIKNKCGCIKQAIEVYRSIVTNNKEQLDSSLENKEQINNVVEESKKEVQTVSIEEFEKLKNENTSLKAALNEGKEVTTTLKSNYDEALKRIESIEKNTRTEKIANILSAIKFKTDEDKQKKIETLVNSNLDIPFIADTYSALQSGNTKCSKSAAEDDECVQRLIAEGKSEDEARSMCSETREAKQASLESKLEFVKSGKIQTEVPDWAVTFMHSGGGFD